MSQSLSYLSPKGPLSNTLLRSAIANANREVDKVIQAEKVKGMKGASMQSKDYTFVRASVCIHDSGYKHKHDVRNSILTILNITLMTVVSLYSDTTVYEIGRYRSTSLHGVTAASRPSITLGR